MTYIGDFVSAANIVHKFTTRDFSTGAPFNLANGVAAVYKAGNTTLFNTGVTLTNSYNNGTGFHELAIDASNTTRYASGTDYAAILTAGTVNSVSVANEVIATFSIENRGVKQVSGDISGNLNGNVKGSITGNVGNVTGNIGGNLAGSVGSVTGNVGNVTGSVGSIAANGINESSFNQNAGSMWPLMIVDQGVAQNANVANIQFRAGLTVNTNDIIGAVVSVVSGNNGVGQSRSIVSYNSANKVAQVDPWTSVPTGTINYKIFAAAPFPTNVATNVTGTITGSVTGNVGNVTGNIGGSVAGSVGSVVSNVNTQFVANNGIIAASFNANAITGRVVFNDVDIRNVNGNVTGSVGSVTGNVGNVTGNLGGTVATVTTITNFNALVKAQIVSAISSDTYAEPTQGTPASTLDLVNKVNYLYKAWRNKTTQTNNTLSLFAADNVTVDQKATVSDNGTVYTRGTTVTGP